MSTPSVLNPLATVQIRGESITVKELVWKDYLRAMKDMTGAILSILAKDGTIVLNREKIIEAITAQEELVSWVLQRSTGKDAKWVDSLSAREFLPLLEAVVDLNLSEEVVGQGKRVAGRLGQVLALKKISLAPSTTSSGPAATPSKT